MTTRRRTRGDARRTMRGGRTRRGASLHRHGARSALAALLVGAAAAGPVAAQDIGACDGAVVGDLGIVGYRCATDDCRMVHTRWSPEGGEAGTGTRGIWLYSTEPTVTDVRPGSPLDGVLRPGDRLVAVGGALITTREASVALQTLEPGESVRVAYRRGGRIREATVRAGGRCVEDAPDPEGARPRPPGTGAGVGRLGGIGLGAGSRGPERVSQVPAAGRPSSAATPGVWLGMAFQCDDCVVRTTGETVVWSFSRPIEILQVESGGPADRAGLRPGDRVVGVAGHAIESDEGGRAWGSLAPGEGVVLEVVRSGGGAHDVEVVPEVRGIARGGSAVPPPRWEDDEPGVRGGIVRYTGVLGGAAVEVRGAPVDVVTDEEAGLLLIYTGTNVVRIRVAGG